MSYPGSRGTRDSTARGGTGNEKGDLAVAPYSSSGIELLDGELFRGAVRLLRQRQLEHAIAVLRLRFRLVDLVPEAERPRDLTVATLAVHQALAVLDVLLVADLGGQGDLVAVDVHLNVFLPYPGQVCDHLERAFLLGHVHFDPRCGYRRVGGYRTDEKALHEIVEQIAEGVITSYVCHIALLASNEFRGLRPTRQE